jgi:molybdopterin-guanine dinucleotide biosynthesis protein A
VSCAAAILAGGKATRMGGENKALLRVDGRRIIDRQLDVLRRLFADDAIVIAANDPAPYADLPHRVVADPIPNAGPLGGLLAAIEATSTDHEHVLLLACDMPWIDVAALRLVVAPEDHSDIVIPIVAGRPEPLFARYARGIAPIVVRRLAGARHCMRDLSEDPALRVTHIDEAALRAIDPALRFLSNCNTPADLDAARRS